MFKKLRHYAVDKLTKYFKYLLNMAWKRDFIFGQVKDSGQYQLRSGSSYLPTVLTYAELFRIWGLFVLYM